MVSRDSNSFGDPVSDACRPRRRLAPRSGRRDPARWRQRSRGKRSLISARPRRKRRGVILGPLARGMAANLCRGPGHVHTAARFGESTSMTERLSVALRILVALGMSAALSHPSIRWARLATWLWTSPLDASTATTGLRSPCGTVWRPSTRSPGLTVRRRSPPRRSRSSVGMTPTSRALGRLIA